MEVVVLIGDLPPSPPATVTADTLRGLRSPSGEPACSSQLRRALDWIGDRTVSLDDALDWAASAGLDVGWVKSAMDLHGHGYGHGYGHGDGHGDGYGHGYGHGYGS